jgi:hypothetical protein
MAILTYHNHTLYAFISDQNNYVSKMMSFPMPEELEADREPIYIRADHCREAIEWHRHFKEQYENDLNRVNFRAVSGIEFIKRCLAWLWYRTIGNVSFWQKNHDAYQQSLQFFTKLYEEMQAVELQRTALAAKKRPEPESFPQTTASPELPIVEVEAPSLSKAPEPVPAAMTSVAAIHEIHRTEPPEVEILEGDDAQCRLRSQFLMNSGTNAEFYLFLFNHLLPGNLAKLESFRSADHAFHFTATFASPCKASVSILTLKTPTKVTGVIRYVEEATEITFGDGELIGKLLFAKRKLDRIVIRENSIECHVKKLDGSEESVITFSPEQFMAKFKKIVWLPS